MHRVAILAYNQVSMFELACAIEIFGLPRPEYRDWYQTDVVSFEHMPLNTTSGVKLVTLEANDLDNYDTLVIPSWSTINKRIRLNVAEAINRFTEQGKRIISFCSGAFLLAQLGLLQNKQATTHWLYADIFKQRFSKVNFVDDVLYVQNDNIFCSAGSAAALDLGLHIIRLDYGSHVANQVARRLVISPHRQGGQSQYIEAPMGKTEGVFSKTLDWAIEHINEPLSVDDLAIQANMSRRSFDRHFRKSLGVSPKTWLNQQRINLAKQILEVETISVDQLAKRVGFDSGITLRFNFNKYVGVAPSHYQVQFSEK